VTNPFSEAVLNSFQHQAWVCKFFRFTVDDPTIPTRYNLLRRRG